MNVRALEPPGNRPSANSASAERPNATRILESAYGGEYAGKIMLQVLRHRPLFGFGVGLVFGSLGAVIGALLIAKPPLDPARLSEFSVVEMIDALPHKTGAEVGVHSSDWAEPFTPTEQDPRFMPGPRGQTKGGLRRKPIVSPVMLELVRRGPSALPALLEHLDDARPTEFFVLRPTEVPARRMSHGDEYDARQTLRPSQPCTVNTHREVLIKRSTYRLRVGDLCYVAIGQIVNRRLEALRCQATGAVLINSPVETPALADAVRKDWAGVSAADHRRSLILDGFSLNESRAKGAGARLQFYYPEAYESYRVEVGLLASTALGSDTLLFAVRYHLATAERFMARSRAEVKGQFGGTRGQFAKSAEIND